MMERDRRMAPLSAAVGSIETRCRMRRLSMAAVAAVIPAIVASTPCSAAEPRSPLAVAGCWLVVPKGDKPERANAAEILCFGWDGRGRIAESRFYGDVTACGRVSYRISHGPTYVEVDLAACRNGGPSHRLVCAVNSGRPIACLQSVPGDDDPVEMELHPLRGGGS